MLKGRHLIDSQDLTVRELKSIFNLTTEIINRPKDFHIFVMVESLVPYFMSLALEPNLVLKPQC